MKPKQTALHDGLDGQNENLDRVRNCNKPQQPNTPQQLQICLKQSFFPEIQWKVRECPTISTSDTHVWPLQCGKLPTIVQSRNKSSAFKHLHEFFTKVLVQNKFNVWWCKEHLLVTFGVCEDGWNPEWLTRRPTPGVPHFLGPVLGHVVRSFESFCVHFSRHLRFWTWTG